MSIRIEHRKGRGIVVDINVMRPDGFVHRERRRAPIQDEKAAWTWAKRREQFLLTGRDPGARSARSVDQPGSIYFAGTSGAVKIGWSCDVSRRMANMQTAQHEPLSVLATIPGTIRDERALHCRFAHLRIRREWFRPEADLLAFIAETRIGAGVEQVARKG